ncbi:hypothetical protein L1987_27386 [Smallanthus sonchifolius]|uniref:Uncharacterized protein n=1 Tax=Smallanthus sonchifolius TaxID=185202 RepID=A0ACB9IC30_9ASTR|nr:hypothetical protein L1987_27386 [Smallanthus sonchifolius]
MCILLLTFCDVPKPVTALTKVEKHKFDQEMKTCETLTMFLPKEIIHSLGKCPTSRDLWEALKKKGEATSQSFVVLIKEVLEKQGDSQKSFQTVEDDLSESEIDTDPVIFAQKGEADDDDKMMRLMDDNINLICDMKSMHTVNQKLKDNENVCIERIESLKRDISSLTLKIKEQVYHLYISFKEIEKRNNDLTEKDMELAESKTESQVKIWVYFDESDDEYFDEAKVEGIPKEVKKEDSKVDSNSSGNNTFGRSSNSRRVPYARDYKDRRTCFHCNEMGHIVVTCPYKNKGKKHVVPEKMKPESKPVEKRFVPSQTLKEVHVGEYSSSASYRVKIPYMREYNETRSCFYCGLVGHIRIACPHNAKGNQHVTPKKVRTLGKPYVNPNVVKPHDTPKGNSKSKVRLSRPQRRRRNKRLRKLLEQQELSQSTHFSNA